MWRRLWLAVVVSVAATGAQASCKFAADQVATPRGVAELLLRTSDFVGFAEVMTPLNTSADQSEQIDVLLAFKGPNSILTLENPVESPGIITVTNAAPSFYASKGAVVFGALTRTKAGWARGECSQSLLHKFPLSSIVAELRRRDRL